MSNQCPYCGSLRNVCVSSVSVRHICLACEKFFIKGEQPKQTVFDRITASLESPAEAIVYEESEHSILNENGYGATFPGGWTSSIIEYSYSTKEEAVAATVEKLKEVAE